MPIDSRDFYAEYHGHTVEHLREVHEVLRVTESGGRDRRPLIWLAGDSSLDNKYWIPRPTTVALALCASASGGEGLKPLHLPPPARLPACTLDVQNATGGYEKVLDPPMSRQDVCHCLNADLVARQSQYRCINTAVEATMLRQRSCANLLEQDCFLRDNLGEEDVVVVSVGGNDIALAPAPCTILHMLVGICCTPTTAIRHAFGRPLPCDDCCCGCGPGCCSTMSACPPSGGYFLHMFLIKLQAYVRALTKKTRPAKILVCMIYYPDVHADGSWADGTLKVLNYNTNPKKLQLLIAKMFEKAVSKITAHGSQVVPVALYEALDGSDPDDYVQRVEPSIQGGRKMAKLLLSKAFGSHADGEGAGAGQGGNAGKQRQDAPHLEQGECVGPVPRALPVALHIQ